MKKRKLNYRFHNPNTAAETANCLLEILLEANTRKVEEAIQKAAGQSASHDIHHEDVTLCNSNIRCDLLQTGNFAPKMIL